MKVTLESLLNQADMPRIATEGFLDKFKSKKMPAADLETIVKAHLPEIKKIAKTSVESVCAEHKIQKGLKFDPGDIEVSTYKNKTSLWVQLVYYNVHDIVKTIDLPDQDTPRNARDDDVYVHIIETIDSTFNKVKEYLKTKNLNKLLKISSDGYWDDGHCTLENKIILVPSETNKE